MKHLWHSHHPFRIFWFSALLTVLLGGAVFGHLGTSGLWVFAILVLLEVTFSFDNAIINSRVLATLSPFWQKIFLTVGIFIAVFVVRFVLPIVIVMIAAHLGFGDVVQLALHDPARPGPRRPRAAGQQGQRNVVNGAARADTERVLEDPRNTGTLRASRTGDGDRSLGRSVPSRDQRQQG